MKDDHLVVTADDFGLDIAINEAVEIAHRDGILSAASLMVAGAAATDAVARARQLPRLRVGLHLVLVEGAPMLPPERIPDLVDADGLLRRDMVHLAIAIATRARVRRQVIAEIGAQFEAFEASGLALDHVNAHKHFHLHPFVADIVLSVGRRFGLRAMRVPYEPASVLRRAGCDDCGGIVEAKMARRLQRVADKAGVLRADAVLGLQWSGAMTAKRLALLLRAKPAGLVEIYTHPATSNAFEGHAAGYRYRDELAALCDPACRALAAKSVGYADVIAAAMIDGAPAAATHLARMS